MDDNQIPEDIDLFEELSQTQEGDSQHEIAEPSKSAGLKQLPVEEEEESKAEEGAAIGSDKKTEPAVAGERPPSNCDANNGAGGTFQGDVGEEMKEEGVVTEGDQPAAASSDFIVVSGEECHCTSEGFPITCASAACVNKFASPPQPESAEVVQELDGPNNYGAGAGSPHQPDEGDVSDLLPENNSLIIVGASRDDSEGDVMSPGDGTAGSVAASLRSTSETKEAKRQRMAELARQRYQNLSTDEKKAVNSRRMLLRKRKRQREREMEELERILRRSNDIEEDIYFVSEIQERRRRENARTRYQNMTTDERKAYNSRRRLRQLTGDSSKDDEVRRHIAAQNARKAELARQRYHRMNPNERRTYNRRRTESLRRRRTEEEALLSTPAGQISAEALQRAQQIMERNAARAEKARERYRRKMAQLRTGQPHSSSSQHSSQIHHPPHYVQHHPSSSQHSIQPRHSAVPVSHHSQQQPHQVHVVHPQQHQQQQQVYHIPAQHPHQPQQIIIQPVGATHAGHQQAATQLVTQMPTSAMPKRFRKGRKGAVKVDESERGLHGGGEPETECDVLGAIERDLLRRTQQAKMVLEQQKASTSGVKQQDMSSPQQTHVVQLVQHPHHQQQQATHLVSGGAQGHYGHGDNTAQIIGGDGKAGTRYVSYVPLPAGATQQGFLLPDGQFVAIQPQDGHTYAVEHPYENHSTAYQQQPTSTAGTTIVRTHRGGGGHASHANQQQPIIVGQRVELVHQDPGTSSYHGSTPGGGLHLPPHSGTIHVVNYQQQGQGGHGHLANHHPPQRHHGSRMGVMASVMGSPEIGGVMDEKTQVQKAKRAERARRRYHEMSAEARHAFNARRAQALKMARLRDEELCRLGDEIDINQSDMDDELRGAIHQARLRRAKRAESARQKYQRMTPEQRKAHNALRDAQRRMRKREMEEKGLPDEH